MKKEKPFLTISEKNAIKERKKRRRLATLVFLLLVSVGINIWQIRNFKIPYINTGNRITILDMLFVNNDEYAAFIEQNKPDFEFVVIDAGTRKRYVLENNGDRSTLIITEDGNYFDRTQCDFSIDKWNDMKTLILKYQLHWYNASDHVNSDGKVIDQNDKYKLSFIKWSLVQYSLETPKNAKNIESFLHTMEEAAKKDAEAKKGLFEEELNEDFVGYFEKISIKIGDETYVLTDKGSVCGFSYQGEKGYYNCDFVIEKMEEVKSLILKNELKWAGSSMDADADGKVTYTKYDSEYIVELYDQWGISGKRIETPSNIDKIMECLDNLLLVAQK